MAKPQPKSDLRLVQEQLEVIQGQNRHFHDMLHALAKTQIAHGKILCQLAQDNKDLGALAAATAELKQETAELQVSIDAQKPAA